MIANQNRRKALKQMGAGAVCAITGLPLLSQFAFSATLPLVQNSETKKAISKGLNWIAGQQTRLGHWAHDSYPTAMAALAGTALICSGSTTTQGPYAKNIRRAVDYLVSKCRRNGLIGDPKRDHRYTYGHGFAMLFLSQVLGEEEDVDRRDELTNILERAVRFSVNAQTKAGGWGYVTAKESDFDEGSTTITQVQGLRGCRNAGIIVPKKAIDNAIKYIYKCQNKDGGISYSTNSLGSSRAAITAAALAALYNAGVYETSSAKDKKYIDSMWNYCKKNLHNVQHNQYGHWHYTYLYYSQVVYRQEPDVWRPFRDKLYKIIVNDQTNGGNWTGNIGDVYVTSCNLIMLQLDNGYLPIYQR